jgi:IclR family transcriptional regulator, KDG regulon repressor
MEVVHRALDILEVFLKQPGEVGIADLAALSAVNISTTHRIVSDLVKRGYLRQRQKRGKYTVGVKLLEFGPAIQMTLKIGEIATPYLQKLSTITGEYAEVAILDSFDAVTVAQEEVEHNLKISNIVGERLPLHATSVGKILLAYMKVEDRKAFYEHHSLKIFNENTIANIGQMEKEVTQIRENGVAFDKEEYDIGIWSAAAPVFDFSNSVIAGLALAAPSVRVGDGDDQEFTSLVKNTALEISREMGYRQ